MTAKTCDACGIVGTPKVRVVKRPDGTATHSHCRPDGWRLEQAKAWQKANPEKVAGYKARWYAENAEELRRRAKEYRDRLTPEERYRRRKESEERNAEAYKERRRRGHLRRYGITVEDYEEMLEAQGGVCAICAKHEWAKSKGKVVRLSVDHNHTTGAVRSLICRRCNVAVGVMENDGDYLVDRVRAYLEDHNGDC